MTRTRSKAKTSEIIDINQLNGYSFEKLREALENVTDSANFCRNIFQTALSDLSPSIMNIIYKMFQIHANTALKDELMSYFGLPIFTSLSETKLNYEVELCNDKRLSEAIQNVSERMKTDADLALQADFFSKFVYCILSSKDSECFECAMKILTILLLQPSSRRFTKPVLEDRLFISIIKQKWDQQLNISDLENVFYSPIDEVSGIFYEQKEEYVAAHFQKIRNLQMKLLNYSELASFSEIPLSSFKSIEQFLPALCQFSPDNLKVILSHMGIAGYPTDIPVPILVDCISSSLVLRSPMSNDNLCAYPTESDLASRNLLRPLTTESLSKHELFQRHHKLLQANLLHELSEHVMENIKACKPVLNRNGKTEFSGWTRDSMEVVASAIIRTSEPDVIKQGKYQRIELEISVPLAPLDQITLKSWYDMKASEVIFVCRVDAHESGDFELKTLRSVIVDSKSITSNVLTLKLLVDPDQFELSSRTEIFSKLNFVVKRTSSESNDVRLLRSISRQFDKNLPDYLEDSIIGINHPDDIIDPEFSIDYKGCNLTEEQCQAVFKCLNSGVSICEGGFGTGCTTVLKESVKCLHDNDSKSVIIFRSGPAVEKFYQDSISCNIPEYQIVRLGFSSTLENIQQKYNSIIKGHVELINIEILSGLDSNIIYTCGEADYVMRGIIQPRWDAFYILMANEKDRDNLVKNYPFANCLAFNSEESFESHFDRIVSVFNVAKILSPLELLQSSLNVSKYVLQNLAKVVVMTSKYAAINANTLLESGLNFDNLLVDDCNLIPEIEVLLALTAQKDPSNMKRLALFAHGNGGRPQCFDSNLLVAGATVSIFDRFIGSGFSKSCHLSFNETFISPWKTWTESNRVNKSEPFDSCLNFVHVPIVIGKGEEIPTRNYIQNLDEAEYSAAIFQLLRLNDVPAKDIAILAAYNGQVDLIKEVLQSRCEWTDYYGEPGFIGTIDQSIGLQFKNVIISLVRTKSIGFLSDTSRLELAVTRASDNLLILGSADLFASEGAFFESLVKKTGGELKLKNGTNFSNVEQITSHVYESSMQKLQ